MAAETRDKRQVAKNNDVIENQFTGVEEIPKEVRDRVKRATGILSKCRNRNYIARRRNIIYIFDKLKLGNFEKV